MSREPDARHTVRFSRRVACDAILHSYSIIFFTQHRGLGLVLLLSTFVAPQFGLIGLAGLVVSLAVAWVLGFDREALLNGSYLFNSLLVSLALAYLYNYQPLNIAALVLLIRMVHG